MSPKHVYQAVLVVIAVMGLSLGATAQHGDVCPIPSDPGIVMDLIWALADTDGDGGLSYNELYAFQPIDRDMFNALDMNRDGVISRDELGALAPYLPGGLLPLIDTNLNGIIEYSEVASYVSPEQFARIDRDGNGVIDCHDLSTAPPPPPPPNEGELPPPPPDGPCPLPRLGVADVLPLVWPILDANGDGALSYQELVAWYPDLEIVYFNLADANGNGLLEIREVLHVAPVLLPGDVVDYLDYNGDRLLQYEELSADISREQFDLLDVNNNGVIDCEDLRLLMPPPPPGEGELPPPPPPGPCPLPRLGVADVLPLVWPIVDTDGDGTLSYQELVTWYPDLEIVYFNLADANGNGLLEMREVLHVAPVLLPGDIVGYLDYNGDRLLQYEELSGDISREQFDLLDVNNNGVIDCEDLRLLMPPPPPGEGELPPPPPPPPGPCPLPRLGVADVLPLVWPIVDTDGDGGLSYQELLVWYPDLDIAYFNAADANRNGLIEMREALLIAPLLVPGDVVGYFDRNGDRLLQYEELSGDITREQFNLLDVNNNGVIDCEDLRLLMPPPPPPPGEGELPPPPPPGPVPCPLPMISAERLLSAGWPLLDADGDGILSLDELTAVGLNITPDDYSIIEYTVGGTIGFNEALLLLPILFAVDAEDVIAALDHNDDRLLQYQEVSVYVSADQFRLLDLNGNGVIDCEDLVVFGVLPLPSDDDDIWIYPIIDDPEDDEAEEDNTRPGIGEDEPCPLPDVTPLLLDIVFLVFDRNSDGYITLREIERVSPELAAMIEPYYLFGPLDRVMITGVLMGLGVDVMSYVDLNGDGVVQYEEFVELAGEENGQYFALLDINENGVFDCVDYAYITAPYMPAQGDADCGTLDMLTLFVRAIMYYADENGDGEITFDEVEAIAGENTGPVFAILDKDRDNIITTTEVWAFLIEFPLNIIHILDQDQDGVITWEEVGWFFPEELFAVMDVNGDGVLDCEDAIWAPVEPGEGEGETDPDPGEGELEPGEGEVDPGEGETDPDPDEGESGDDEDWDWLPYPDGDLASPQMVNMLRRMFRMLDTNRDGQLSPAEIRGRVTLPPGTFEALDIDGNGFISWAELTAWQQSFAEAPVETVLEIVRSVIGEHGANFFRPGVPVEFRVRIMRRGEALIRRLMLTELLPDGWDLVNVSEKSGLDVALKTGHGGRSLRFESGDAPVFPLDIVYYATPRVDAQGVLSVMGQLGYELESGEARNLGVVPTVLLEAMPDEYAHSADLNRNWRIELPELLRVIQLYNSGGYHLNPENEEDGYGLGWGELMPEGWNHSADYLGNWRITLPELLRVVQLYNNESRYYYTAEDTEDGYTPAPF